MSEFDATDGEQVAAVVDRITYRDGYDFLVHEALGDGDLVIGVELLVQRPDAITGEMGAGYGGIRWLSRFASKSDVVRMVFGAILAYEEHEAREFFRYRGAQVFGPHGDVEALVEAAQHTDYREREVSKG